MCGPGSEDSIGIGSKLTWSPGRRLSRFSARWGAAHHASGGPRSSITIQTGEATAANLHSDVSKLNSGAVSRGAVTKQQDHVTVNYTIPVKTFLHGTVKKKTRSSGICAFLLNSFSLLWGGFEGHIRSDKQPLYQTTRTRIRAKTWRNGLHTLDFFLLILV